MLDQRLPLLFLLPLFFNAESTGVPRRHVFVQGFSLPGMSMPWCLSGGLSSRLPEQIQQPAGASSRGWATRGPKGERHESHGSKEVGAGGPVDVLAGPP